MDETEILQPHSDEMHQSVHPAPQDEVHICILRKWKSEENAYGYEQRGMNHLKCTLKMYRPQPLVRIGGPKGQGSHPPPPPPPPSVVSFKYIVSEVLMELELRDRQVHTLVVKKWTYFLIGTKYLSRK